MSESVVQTLFELWQLGAMPTALCSPFHVHRPLVQTLSLTPSCPSPDTAPCRSLGPCRCHTEQSSALPLRSCEELQPPSGLPQLLCSGLSKPRGLSCSFLFFAITRTLLWTLSNSFISFYCGAQTRMQCSRQGRTAQQSGTTHSLKQLTRILRSLES